MLKIRRVNDKLLKSFHKEQEYANIPILCGRSRGWSWNNQVTMQESWGLVKWKQDFKIFFNDMPWWDQNQINKEGNTAT